MKKMTKEQVGFNFATDLGSLLSMAPDHLELMGIGYGGFSWQHHMSALMIVACLSDIEVALGKSSWRTYGIHTDEFEALRYMRNAYVHTSSDLSKVNDKKAFSHVLIFLKELTDGKILGIKGQVIDPYFSLNGTVFQLEDNAIRRVRSLYLQVMMAAGKIVD